MGKGRVSFMFAVFTLLFVFHGVSVADTVANSDGNTAAKGDPICTATGEHYFTTTDIFLGGPLPLAFSRYYASMLGADGNVTSALGNNWMHNFDIRLVVSGQEATVVYYRGKIIQFQKAGGDWVLKNPEPVTYQLVEPGGRAKLYRLMDPSTSLIFTFESPFGALTRVEDRNGNALSLTYKGGSLSQVSDGLGRSLTLAYTKGKLTKVHDQSGRSISFSHTGDNLTFFTDARGNTTRYNYTETGGLVGLMTYQSRPEGNIPYTQTFDKEGRVVRQSDSQNNASDLLYNTPSEGVTTVIDPLNNSNAYTHRELKYLAEHLDPDRETISLGYDDHNRRTKLKDRLGATTSMTYHTFGKLASETDTEDNTTTYTYKAQGQGDFTYHNPTRVDYPDGAFITMTHDEKGNILSLTDGAGEEWVYTYNSSGQVLTATNPSGGVTIFTYSENGNLANVTDPVGNTTRFDYDALNRLIKITHPDDTFRSYTYDANDNLLTVTKGDREVQKVTTYTYDSNDNLKSVTDPLGKTVTIAYDGNDRATTIFDQLIKPTTCTYDELERLETVTNAAGEKVTYGYNAHGWLSSVTDPGGETTSMAHDREGIISSVTDALSHTWKHTTDGLGRITRITSPLTYNDDYTYDSMNRLISHTNPLSQMTTYNYDSRGLITEIGLPEGISASYTRNELGLITQVADPNGNAWVRAYDEMGRLISTTDPLLNQTSYEYDSRNRVSRTILPESSVDFTYDESGNITGRLYSDGTDLQYTYDDNNRLLTANDLSLSYDARGDIIGCNGLSIARDEVGRITTLTLASGKAVTYGYNERGLVSQVKDWVEGVTQLTYNDAGQLATISRPNGVTTTYTYDEDGRLVSVKESAGEPESLSSIVLTLDGAGQVTSADRNVPLMPDITTEIRTFTYDAACQIESYDYDSMGRLTAGDGRAYTWDLASRLTSLTEDSNTTTFTYNGLGMRISRTSGGTTQKYVWNYALGIPSVSVVRQGRSDVRYYVHLPGGRLLHSVEAGDNSRRFYHYDEAGTTLFLTDGSGAITDSYGITPHGMVTARTGDAENPFTYRGAYGVIQEGDLYGDLYYMRGRYYDSKTGRFISRDPVASLYPKEINPYKGTVEIPVDVTGNTDGDPLSYYSPEPATSKSPEYPQRYTHSTIPVSENVESSLGIFHPEGFLDTLGSVPILPGNVYGLTIWPAAPSARLDELSEIGISFNYLFPKGAINRVGNSLVKTSTGPIGKLNIDLGMEPADPNVFRDDWYDPPPYQEEPVLAREIDECNEIESYISWSNIHPCASSPEYPQQYTYSTIEPGYAHYVAGIRPATLYLYDCIVGTLYPTSFSLLTEPKSVRETISKYYRLFK